MTDKTNLETATIPVYRQQEVVQPLATVIQAISGIAFLYTVVKFAQTKQKSFGITAGLSFASAVGATAWKTAIVKEKTNKVFTPQADSSVEGTEQQQVPNIEDLSFEEAERTGRYSEFVVNAIGRGEVVISYLEGHELDEAIVSAAKERFESCRPTRHLFEAQFGNHLDEQVVRELDIGTLRWNGWLTHPIGVEKLRECAYQFVLTQLDLDDETLMQDELRPFRDDLSGFVRAVDLTNLSTVDKRLLRLATDNTDQHLRRKVFEQVNGMTELPTQAPDWVQHLPPTQKVAYGDALLRWIECEPLARRRVDLRAHLIAIQVPQSSIEAYIADDTRALLTPALFGADLRREIPVSVSNYLYLTGLDLGDVNSWTEVVEIINTLDRRVGEALALDGPAPRANTVMANARTQLQTLAEIPGIDMVAVKRAYQQLLVHEIKRQWSLTRAPAPQIDISGMLTTDVELEGHILQRYIPDWVRPNREEPWRLGMVTVEAKLARMQEVGVSMGFVDDSWHRQHPGFPLYGDFRPHDQTPMNLLYHNLRKANDVRTIKEVYRTLPFVQPELAALGPEILKLEALILSHPSIDDRASVTEDICWRDMRKKASRAVMMFLEQDAYLVARLKDLHTYGINEPRPVRPDHVAQAVDGLTEHSTMQEKFAGLKAVVEWVFQSECGDNLTLPEHWNYDLLFAKEHNPWPVAHNDGALKNWTEALLQPVRD